MKVAIIHCLLLILSLLVCCGSASENPHDLSEEPTKFAQCDLYGFRFAEIASENEPYNGNIFYIYKYSNPDDDYNYIPIDSFYFESFPSLCDSNAVSYLDFDDSCKYLIIIYLAEKYYRDTILSICDQYKESMYMSEYSLRLSDSILAYYSRINSDTGTIYCTYVTKLISDKIIDTLISIFNAISPTMSGDGSELFVMIKTQSSSEDSMIRSVGIYDIEDNYFWIPFNSDSEIIRAYRLNKYMPLYFLKRRTMSTWDNIWAMTDSANLMQITEYSYPDAILDFTIINDTLLSLAIKNAINGKIRKDFIRIE